METYLAARELILDYLALLRSPQLLHLALALELKPLRLTAPAPISSSWPPAGLLGLHIVNPEDDQPVQDAGNRPPRPVLASFESRTMLALLRPCRQTVCIPKPGPSSYA